MDDGGAPVGPPLARSGAMGLNTEEADNAEDCVPRQTYLQHGIMSPAGQSRRPHLRPTITREGLPIRYNIANSFYD